MFVGIAALGLWVSRNYPVGTALRMGTATCRACSAGLMGLGVIVLVQGLREKDTARAPRPARSRSSGRSSW